MPLFLVRDHLVFTYASEELFVLLITISDQLRCFAAPARPDVTFICQMS